MIASHTAASNTTMPPSRRRNAAYRARISLSLSPPLSLPPGESRGSRTQSRPRDEVVIVALMVTTVGDVSSILSARSPAGTASAPTGRKPRKSLLSSPSSLLPWAHSRAHGSSRTHTHLPAARTRSRARNTRTAHGITGRADGTWCLRAFFLEGVSLPSGSRVRSPSFFLPFLPSFSSSPLTFILSSLRPRRDAASNSRTPCRLSCSRCGCRARRLNYAHRPPSRRTAVDAPTPR